MQGEHPRNSLECEAVILLELLLFILEAGGLDAQPDTGIEWESYDHRCSPNTLEKHFAHCRLCSKDLNGYMGPPTLMHADQSLQSSSAGADLVAVKSDHENINVSADCICVRVMIMTVPLSLAIRTSSGAC